MIFMYTFFVSNTLLICEFCIKNFFIWKFFTREFTFRMLLILSWFREKVILRASWISIKRSKQWDVKWRIIALHSIYFKYILKMRDINKLNFALVQFCLHQIVFGYWEITTKHLQQFSPTSKKFSILKLFSINFESCDENKTKSLKINQ